MQTFILYSTEGCHLCELAEAVITRSPSFGSFACAVEDIADSDELMEQYAVRIPVLKDEASGAELGWPFDQQQLESFIQQCRQISSIA
ncbi:glutaredoxin family protein [Spongorhabdus nitratireducens]